MPGSKALQAPLYRVGYGAVVADIEMQAGQVLSRAPIASPEPAAPLQEQGQGQGLFGFAGSKAAEKRA